MRRILFKYLTPERASVLDNGLIRFSQAPALNDPFESTALVATASMIKQLDEETDAEIENLIDEYGRDKLLPSDLEKIKLAREMAYRQVRRKVTPGRFGRQLMAMMSAHIGVLSLSRSSKSVLMWSHYARDHTGFVIGLDPSHQFFCEKNAEGNFTEAYDVSYDRDRIAVDQSDPDIYRKLFCQKSPAWKYERETRIFRHLDDESLCGKDAKGIPIHLFCIPKEAICTIIFGANSSPLLRATVFNYICSNEIKAKVYQARISHSNFRIHFNLINSPFSWPGRCWNMISNIFPQCGDINYLDLEELTYGRYLYHGVYRYPSPNAAILLNLENKSIKSVTIGNGALFRGRDNLPTT